MTQEFEGRKTPNSIDIEATGDLSAKTIRTPPAWVMERTIIELLYSPRERMEVFSGTIDLRERPETAPAILNADIFGDIILGPGQTLKLFNVMVRGHVFPNGGKVFYHGQDTTEAIISANLGMAYSPLKNLERVGYVEEEQITALASIPDQFERADKAFDLVQKMTVKYALDMGLKYELIEPRFVNCVRNLKSLDDQYAAAQDIIRKLNNKASESHKSQSEEAKREEAKSEEAQRDEAESSYEAEENAEASFVTPDGYSEEDSVSESLEAKINEEIDEEFAVLSDKIDWINNMIELAIETGVISSGDAMMLLSIDETLENKMGRIAALTIRVEDKEETEKILASGRQLGVISEEEEHEFRSSALDPAHELMQVQDISERIEEHYELQEMIKASKHYLGHCFVHGVIERNVYRAIRDEANPIRKYQLVEGVVPRLKTQLKFDGLLKQALDLNAIDFPEAAKFKNLFRDHGETGIQGEIELRIIQEKTARNYLNFARETGVLDSLGVRHILSMSDRAERLKEAISMRDKALQKAETHCSLVMQLGMERQVLNQEQALDILSIEDPMLRLAEIKKIPKLAELVNLFSVPNE